MVMDKLVAAPYHSQQHPLTEEGQKSLHCQVLAERDTVLTKVRLFLQVTSTRLRVGEQRVFPRVVPLFIL